MRARRFLSNNGFVIFLYFAVLDNGAGSNDMVVYLLQQYIEQGKDLGKNKFCWGWFLAIYDQ